MHLLGDTAEGRASQVQDSISTAFDRKALLCAIDEGGSG